MLFIFSIVPTKAKSSASETPVTISGFVMGMFVMLMDSLRSLGLMEFMPIAAAVPKTVAMTEAMTATITEFRSSGRSTPSENSSR